MAAGSGSLRASKRPPAPGGVVAPVRIAHTDHQHPRAIQAVRVDGSAHRLLPVYPQGEEVGGAGDAGVVVADGLLALPGEGRLREVDARINESPQVRLDGLLVLCRGRHNLRVRDEARVVDGVAVVEDAARALGA